MLDRYIIIDVEQMIADYEDNKATLESLEMQYEELCQKDIGSIDYSKDRVQTMPTEDATGNLVSLKQKLEFDMWEYKWLLKSYDSAWPRLTEKEKYILKEFSLYPRREKQKAVDNICDKYNIEVAQVYTLRRAALDKFKWLMFG
jgi:hypothetical protein